MNQSKRKARTRLRTRLLFAAAAATPLIASRAAHALTINFTFDPSVTTLANKTQFENACNFVAQEFEFLYSNPVTLNIEVTAHSGTSILGESIPTTDNQTYAAVRSALIANATSPDQIQAYSTLPTNAPSGASQISVPTAEDKVLGLSTNGATSDGQFIFGTGYTYSFDQNNRAIPNEIDFFGVAEHEISHLMGRVGGLNPSTPMPLDLFRYTAPGSRTFVNVTGDYFSINGGVSNLKTFDATSDPGDWAGSSPPDSFNAFSSSGVVNDITPPVDTTLMDVLGYRPVTLTTAFTWSGGAADALTGSNWFSGTLTHLNPHINVSLLVNSAGATVTHTFNSEENFTLGRGSDNGVSLTVNNGTFTVAASSTVNSDGTGFGLVLQQNGVLSLGTAGLLNVAGPLSVANDPNVTNASASFSGASVINVGTVVGTDQTFYVGQLGIGAVSQSGSSTVNTPTLDLGDSNGASGTYSLSGSAILNVSTNEFIAYGGNGAFNQSGGTHTIAGGGALILGNVFGASGTYNLSAGSLAVNGTESIGESGVGIFTQSGGSHTVTAGFTMTLGDQSNAIGTYFLSGGTLTSGSNEIVGFSGDGLFNQSGGANSVFGAFNLDLGSNAGATGTYLLSNTATLTDAGSENIGFSGLAIFNQNGGNDTILPGFNLNLARNAGGTGMFIVTAGSTTVGNNVYVGGSLNGAGGKGNLTVSALGSVNVAGTIVAYNTPGNGVTLSGGTLNTAALDFNGLPSLFNWTSGTLGLTAGVTFDPAAGSTTTSAAFGSSLTLGANQTLNVTGNQTVGGTSAFKLTVGSGAFDNISNTLAITKTPASGVTLSGGTINTAALNLNGQPSLLNWITGTLGLTAGVTFDPGAGATTTGAAFGPTLTLAPNQTLNVTGNETLGGTQSFILNQNGGNNFASTVTLNPTSTYSLTAGTLSCTLFNQTGGAASFANLYVDPANVGAFNQSAGTNTIGTSLFLGNNSGATGFYTLSGSGSLSAAGEFVGNSGAGIFNQSGGANTIGGNLMLAANNSSSGTYNLSAGSLSAIFEYVSQSSGAAVFNQTGGANTSVAEFLGDNIFGSSVYNQSGGTNTITGGIGFIALGLAGNSTCSYILSAGSLSVAGNEEIGYAGGRGVFNQSGGAHTITGPGSLFIGLAPSSSGTYILSGGTLVAPNVYVGGSTVAPGGSATFTITQSGSASIPGTLKVWNNGRVNLDVPNTTVGNLSLSGNGIVNLNGALQINYASPANDPVTSVVAALTTGYNNGAWTGTTGIVSTSAAANSISPIASVGYADGNTDIGTPAAANQLLVQYALAGDANLDGAVNFNDLVAVIQNFNKSGADWAHGNFTYASSTGFADLVLVVQNFNKTLPPPTGQSDSLGGDTIALSASSQIQSTDVSLPEPCAVGLLTLSATRLLKRRRNHKSS